MPATYDRELYPLYRESVAAFHALRAMIDAETASDWIWKCDRTVPLAFYGARFYGPQTESETRRVAQLVAHRNAARARDSVVQEAARDDRHRGTFGGVYRGD